MCTGIEIGTVFMKIKRLYCISKYGMYSICIRDTVVFEHRIFQENGYKLCVHHKQEKRNKMLGKMQIITSTMACWTWVTRS